MEIIIGWFKKYDNYHWYEKKTFNNGFPNRHTEGISIKYNYNRFKLFTNQETRMNRIVKYGKKTLL